MTSSSTTSTESDRLVVTEPCARPIGRHVRGPRRERRRGRRYGMASDGKTTAVVIAAYGESKPILSGRDDRLRQ
ncbi:hypothetical protein [Halorubrum vacuolatum]|uniref:hypothetical protein n=1 Tax=Halorubrum vacuolatum TaxID=63740 RepID=UPI00117B2091|nr:hypothetical protein [Halorubrum vacuolatum]